MGILPFPSTIRNNPHNGQKYTLARPTAAGNIFSNLLSLQLSIFI